MYPNYNMYVLFELSYIFKVVYKQPRVLEMAHIHAMQWDVICGPCQLPDTAHDVLPALGPVNLNGAYFFFPFLKTLLHGTARLV